MATLGRLQHIKLKGFRSIRELDLELSPLNILIGANGAGKSNFISFFKFMNKLLEKDFLEARDIYGGEESNFMVSLVFGLNDNFFVYTDREVGSSDGSVLKIEQGDFRRFIHPFGSWLIITGVVENHE